ncbi:hypothetical protein IB257_06195 [Achromobacter sp. ACM03]|uniref:hypothetical protein n=1 Tax=Achromobacter sp. ACM03 TaxID=2769300 RepID=UPI00177F7F71|nr:hypothetical protein [Achromobacter sp. ACM03]MBD9429519.1 hypothetical protein [Achromobacter sp. ACM03]
MSEHHQFLCPRDLHLPPPDWQALETKLLEGGYVLEPRGGNIPYRALLNLSFGLATLNEGSYQYQEPLRTTGDVIAMYVRAGYLPADIPIRHNDTMAEALELLASQGITPGELYADNEGSDWNSPQYCLGPAARPYLTPDTQASYDADPRNFPLMLLAYDGSEPRVAVGENLSEPSLPGSDVLLESMPPFDSHVDFIGAAYEDPAAQWHCAENGRDYRILELDWQYSLTMGFRMVRTEWLDDGSARGLARLIERLTGLVMVCSHRHL